MPNPSTTPANGRSHRAAARLVLTTATAAACVGAAGLPASAAPSGTVEAEVEVSSVISLTGLPTSFTLTGAPGETATTTAPVTMKVLTNNPSGYDVTVAADAANLAPTDTTANTDVIPIDALSVRESGSGSFVPLSTTAVPVHSQAARSASVDGDTVSNDFEIAVPLVKADTYTVALTYVASEKS